jgi:flagellum-specific ATP synthase
LISIGAYRRGGNKLVDAAIDLQDDLNGFLRQRVDQPSSIDEARKGLMLLSQKVQQHATSAGGKS